MAKYGVKVGQIYKPSSGVGVKLEVIDTSTYDHCDDVVVRRLCDGVTYRIDSFKLAMVRYGLEEDL